MNLRSRNKVDASFNMSSLSDIIFLLLIFFMLTSTLVTPNAIKLLLPKSETQTRSPQTVNVSITHDKRYYVDGAEIAYGDLKSKNVLILDENNDVFVYDINVNTNYNANAERNTPHSGTFSVADYLKRISLQ